MVPIEDGYEKEELLLFADLSMHDKVRAASPRLAELCRSRSCTCSSTGTWSNPSGFATRRRKSRTALRPGAKARSTLTRKGMRTGASTVASAC